MCGWGVCSLGVRVWFACLCVVCVWCSLFGLCVVCVVCVCGVCVGVVSVCLGCGLFVFRGWGNECV